MLLEQGLQAALVLGQALKDKIKYFNESQKICKMIYLGKNQKPDIFCPEKFLHPEIPSKE